MTTTKAPSSPHEPGPDVRAAIDALLDRALGARAVAFEPIAAGLGSRRFYRVSLDGSPTTVVARVEGPEDPALRPQGVAPEPPLEPIRAFLETHGLPVPAGLGVDPATGVSLLEDFGDDSLELAASRSAEEVASLYREACGWIPRLQALGPGDAPPAAFERRLDAALFAYKADEFANRALPWALERSATPAEIGAVRTAFAWISSECERAPQRLAHRDYKAANLLLRPGAAPGARLAMIDLQGAFLAPPEYDLVCLLRDSHVSLPRGLAASLREETRVALPDAPAVEEFEHRFDLLTLTRVGKDLARYLYAAQERRDQRYLALLPRAARTLREAAARARGREPRLERLADLVAVLPETTCAP